MRKRPYTKHRQRKMARRRCERLGRDIIAYRSALEDACIRYVGETLAPMIKRMFGGVQFVTAKEVRGLSSAAAFSVPTTGLCTPADKKEGR